MENLGKTIRRWRRQKGLRQEDLEASTGLAQAYLSDLERGDIKDPGISKLVRICKVLGRSLDELVGEASGDSEAARLRPAAA